MQHLLLLQNHCWCPPWNYVKTHLNAPHQQTAKTAAFIEMITLNDYANEVSSFSIVA